MVSKKRKREEKAKTQLKKPKTAPGKHLPKGTNVTKTEFRVAKISIPGQRVDSETSSGEVRTSKKLGLKEILSKLSHFSLATKCDGLEGLKELLSDPSSKLLISNNLSNLLGALMPLSHDLEKKLRKMSVPLITQILSMTPKSSLVPLHKIILAHLCCSLTHIDQRIQQDGLLLLDTTLEHAPGFVRDTYFDLLPNCLDQISSKKKVGSKKEGSSLAANVSDEMTALTWRLLVLSRVEKVLEIIGHPQTGKMNINLEAIQFNEGLPPFTIPSEDPIFLAMSSFAQTASSSSSIALVNQLIPLVIETWIEARATSNTGKKKGSLLSKDEALMLSSIAGILDKLQAILDSESREGFLKFSNDFSKHLLNFIPFNAGHVDCGESNVQLSLLSLFLNETPSDGVLETIMGISSSCKSTAHTKFRLLRQIHGLFERLTQTQKDTLVSSLMSLAESEEIRDDVFSLLETIAVNSCDGEIVSWIQSLPNEFLRLNTLASSNPSESDKAFSNMTTVIKSCLMLIKVKNKTIAETILMHESCINGIKENLAEGLRHYIDCIFFYINRMKTY